MQPENILRLAGGVVEFEDEIRATAATFGVVLIDTPSAQGSGPREVILTWTPPRWAYFYQYRYQKQPPPNPDAYVESGFIRITDPIVEVKITNLEPSTIYGFQVRYWSMQSMPLPPMSTWENFPTQFITTPARIPPPALSLPPEWHAAVAQFFQHTARIVRPDPTEHTDFGTTAQPNTPNLSLIHI